MNYRSFALLLALFGAGCAQLPAVQPAADQPTKDTSAQPAAPAAAAPAPTAQLPKQDLTDDILFEYLVSEIAGQRGKLGLATSGLLDLARKTRDPRLARRATEAAMYSHLEREALEAATLWLQLEPDEPKARQVVTLLLINSGRLAEAKPHLEKLLAGEGENRGLDFMHLNQLLARQQDKAAVLALVQDLAKPYPADPEAHFAIAQAAWGADKDDLALQEIRQALKLRPNWEAAAMFEGLLLQKRSMAEAFDFYKNFLARNPKAEEVRLAYARALVGERRYADARDEFRALVEEFPDNPDVSVAIGLLSLQLKDYDGAEQYLKRALDLQYKDGDAVRMYLAQVFEERKQYAAAADWYDQVGQGEHYLTARIRKAAMVAKQGRLDDARRQLQQLPVQNNQQRVQVVLAEAQLLRDADAYQDAFELLGKALEKLPNYPDLLYDHAMAAEKVGRLDVLEQDLRKLIQLKPDYAHAYNALGYTLAERTERLDEAQKLIEKALSLAPDDAYIMDSMGWVQYRQGRLDKAESYLKRAYGLQPDPEIAAHLGEVLWMEGKRDEAEKLWRAALKANPHHEALLNVLKKFKP
jgi:tetratricopeptide (TPR) repeat protein